MKEETNKEFETRLANEAIEIVEKIDNDYRQKVCYKCSQTQRNKRGCIVSNGQVFCKHLQIARHNKKEYKFFVAGMLKQKIERYREHGLPRR